MRSDGREVYSRTDYILVSYCRLFQDVAVRYLRHNSDHYMVLGCLRREPTKELTEYLRQACRPPLWHIRRYLGYTSDKIFSDLRTQIPKPPLHDQVRQDWIYDETWAAMDARVTACWEGAHRTIQKLS